MPSEVLAYRCAPRGFNRNPAQPSLEQGVSQMHKKLITACLALFALAAFALPAAAQAVNHPLITHPTGTKLATGVKITATNVGETLLVNTTTGAQELACTTASMTGELIKNETGNIQGNITAASFTGTGSGGACTGSFLNPTIEPTGLPW